MRRIPRLAPAVALVALVAVGAGCEYFRDTPEQELADRRWRQCAEGLRDVKLDRVDTDGRIHFTYITYIALNERARVLECLEAAARSGPPLPAPAAAALAGR